MKNKNTYRDISILGIPHSIEIVDGGVLFSNKSGFWGVSGRFMFEYKGRMWYLVGMETTWNQVPINHLVRMREELCNHIETSQPDYLTFKPLD